MKPQIFNLAKFGDIVEDRWNQVPVKPDHLYTSLAALREAANNMIMAPATLRFIVATMDFPQNMIVVMTPAGEVKFLTEDA